MRKKILLFSIFIISLLGENLYSQKIYRDGYIVKKSGETLNGLIEYSMNQDIPSVCAFKRFDIARVVNYMPDEIMAFGYRNGNRYESRRIDNKTSFLEVIVTGKIILYRKGSKFYLDKDRLGLTELKNDDITYSVSGSKTEFRSLSEFLNFLTEGKVGSVSERFNLKTEIEQFISAYNKESGKSYHVYNRTISEKQLTQEANKSGAFKNKFGVLSGVTIYNENIKFNPKIYGLGPALFIIQPEKEMGLVTGLTFERIISRKTDRLSIRLDMMYSRLTFYSYGERLTMTGGISRDDAFFNFSGIKAPLLLQYSVTGNRIVPYINAGIAYQLIINSNYHHIAEAEDMWHNITTSEDRNLHFKTGEFTAAGGLGLRTRLFNNINFHVQGRVEYGMGLFVNKSDDLAEYIKKDPFTQSSLQGTILVGITF